MADGQHCELLAIAYKRASTLFAVPCRRLRCSPVQDGGCQEVHEGDVVTIAYNEAGGGDGVRYYDAHVVGVERADHGEAHAWRTQDTASKGDLSRIQTFLGGGPDLIMWKGGQIQSKSRRAGSKQVKSRLHASRQQAMQIAN
eukprot:366124-Chlamydomonas_euryale.AAC.23